MSDKCKNCGESLIITHHWGTRGWDHYWASHTCSNPEPAEQEKEANAHEWKHHQCVRCAVLRESPNALSPCDAVVEKASEVAS